MIKSRNVNIIEVSDWNKLVSETYGKPYNFQQQDGCKSRGYFQIFIPFEYIEDDEMNEEIPEHINSEIMGVKFTKWLERDPNDLTIYNNKIWWNRKFYPDIYTLANDLHKRNLINEGEYLIHIDW